MMPAASQPTLSRFENAVRRADLYRMGRALAETVIERHRRRLKRKVKRITIDLDPTDDPTHGAQQLTFFNAHYDSWCYLPVAGFLTFNDEADQYLFAVDNITTVRIDLAKNGCPRERRQWRIPSKSLSLNSGKHGMPRGSNAPRFTLASSSAKARSSN